jgi:hypothetical protein
MKRLNATGKEVIKGECIRLQATSTFAGIYFGTTCHWHTPKVTLPRSSFIEYEERTVLTTAKTTQARQASLDSELLVLGLVQSLANSSPTLQTASLNNTKYGAFPVSNV